MAKEKPKKGADPAQDIRVLEERAFTRMAPVISHEIRNPLAIIGNSVYFIKAKLSAAGPLDPKVEKHLGIIDSEIKHANDTLGEILAFTRMRVPAVQIHPLGALLQAASQSLQKPASVELTIDVPAQDPTVSADSELITRCIIHLLRNAFEAAGMGAVSARVRAEAGSAVLEVSDTGPGLAAELDGKLFTPFITTRPRGIGLGLAFVRKVVLAHGGTIEAQSPPGKGAAFRLSLPLSS